MKFYDKSFETDFRNLGISMIKSLFLHLSATNFLILVGEKWFSRKTEKAVLIMSFPVQTINKIPLKTSHIIVSYSHA